MIHSLTWKYVLCGYHAENKVFELLVKQKSERVSKRNPPKFISRRNPSGWTKLSAMSSELFPLVYSKWLISTKALFGCDGPIPLGDRFCCENGLSILKRTFVWDDGMEPSQPNRA